MPEYTIRDKQTQKEVTFKWSGTQPPTDTDMEQVFATARQQQPDKFQDLAKTAVGVVEPGPQQVPGQSFLQRLGAATKETFLPSWEGVKRLFSPQVGQFGLSRLAQQEGEKVQKAVSAVSPMAGAVLPPLTPRSAAEQVGGEVAGRGLGVAAKAIDKTVVAPFQQLMTGIPGKEWLRLSKNIGTLRPEWLGGAPSKEAAGKAIGEAEQVVGIFKSELPSGLGKEYVTSFLDNLKKYTATGTERGLTDRQLADPKVIKSMIGELTPQETATLREATNNTLKEWVAGKNGDEYRRYSILLNNLNEHLADIAPAIRKAQKSFGDAAQRSKFMSAFPKTKYGEPSLGRLGFTGMISAGAGASGYQQGPEEMAKRAATVFLATSPAAHTAARVAAKIPVARGGFQAIIAKYREGQNKK